MWNATMPIWIGVLFIVALALLALYMAFVAAGKERAKESLAASKQEIIDARTQERDEARKQRDELNRENESLHQANKNIVKQSSDLHAQNKSLDEDNACMAEANAGIAKERDEWMRLYNELLTTYHDAQGDAHATVPLQEVAPASVKRTRKPKAETKQ